MKWLTNRVDKRVEETLEEKLAILLAEAKQELARGNASYDEEDSLVLGGRSSYTLLEREWQKPGLLHGWFDLGDLKDGDKIRLEFLVYLKGGWMRWELMEFEGKQDSPAVRLSNLWSPRGVKIVATHLAGREYRLNWHLARYL